MAAHFAFSTPQFPQGDDWGETIRNVLQDPILAPGPLSALQQFDRSVRIELREGHPYLLTGDNGELLWREKSRNAALYWPFLSERHLIAVQFGLEERRAYGVIAGSDSRLTLIDEEEMSRLLIAHRWNALRVRWAADLKLRHSAGANRFEPEYEAGWGAESGTSIRLRFYHRDSESKVNWRIKDDTLAAVLPLKHNGGAIDLTFGELFGTRVSAIFTDEQIVKPAVSQTGYQFATTAEIRGASLQLEQATLKGIGWRLKVRRKELVGDALLRKGGEIAGQAVNVSQESGGAGVELTGLLPSQIRWWSEISYDRLKGSAGGKVDFPFPGEFGVVVDGGRNYIALTRLEGLRLAARLSIERKKYKASAGFGYGNYETRLSIKDQQPGEPLIRDTAITLKGFGAIWANLSGEMSIGKARLGTNVSQAFLLNARPSGQEPVGPNASLKGGWKAGVSLGYVL